MKTYRTGTLPPDLKSLSQVNRNEDLKEALYTLVSLVLMVALFFMFMFAIAIPSEPQVHPVGWEEVRG